MAKLFVTAVIFAVLTMVQFFWTAIAVVLNWNWFVADPFNLPRLTMLHTVGLFCVLMPLMRYIPRDQDDVWPVLRHELVQPAIAIGLGYLLHLAF